MQHHKKNKNTTPHEKCALNYSKTTTFPWLVLSSLVAYKSRSGTGAQHKSLLRSEGWA